MLAFFIISGFSFSKTKSSQLLRIKNDATKEIVLDSSNEEKLPQSFRATNLKTSSNEKINMHGLKELKISGSAQFSSNNLECMIKEIPCFPFAIIDLRREPHGFMNGVAFSWANASVDKTVSSKQLILIEHKMIRSIPLHTALTFYKPKNFTLTPSSVCSELDLLKGMDLPYVRIPVGDDLPTSENIDLFVEFIKNQPSNLWLHFHCDHGTGRTTTFMIMCDMMKSAYKVDSLNIVNRQCMLASMKPEIYTEFKNQHRTDFLLKFHQYCSENYPNFDITWSAWSSELGS